jgi:hypothetical protein
LNSASEGFTYPLKPLKKGKVRHEFNMLVQEEALGRSNHLLAATAAEKVRSAINPTKKKTIL